MKRFGISTLGFLFGLFLTWACLYVGQFIRWHPLRKIGWLTAGPGNPMCRDLEHCSKAPWTLYLFLFLLILGPALAFTATNFFAWKRWSLAKWSKWQGALTLCIVAFYFLLQLM